MKQQMEHPEEKDEKMKEQLHVVEVERDRALDELREMKKLAQEANMRLSEALSSHNVEEVHLQLSSMKDLLSHARLELKNKEESIESLKLELGKAKDLELRLAENVEASEANTKVLLCESEKQIQELQQKLADSMKTSEAQTKASLSKSEKRIRELELKLAEKAISSEDKDDTEASLAERDEKIHELELKLAENANISEAHRKALLTENAERIRKLELKLAENVQTNEAQLKALLFASEERIRELEMEIEKRRNSEARVLDSLITQTNQLEQTKVLLEESNSENVSLQKKLDNWEEESLQSSELSSCHQHDSHDSTFSSRDDLVSLKSELQLTKEGLVDAQKEQLASSNVENLVKEIGMLKHELKLTAEAEENSKQALDDMACALKEVATEANQLKDILQMTKAELEHSRAQEERLNAILKSNEENFRLILDEAKKEAERYKNTAARLKIEHEESVLAWSGKETGFVNCIRRAEEDRHATQQENFRLHQSLLETDNKVMLSKEENSKLRDILKQALSEANVAKEAAAIAQAEHSQLKDSLEEKEEALYFLTRENENYRVNEIAANENIKELKRLLIELSNKDCKKEEKENLLLKDVRKESKTPTKESKKDAKDSKKEQKDRTPTKDLKKHKDRTPTKEDCGKEKPPVPWEAKKEDKEKTSSDKDKEKEAAAGNILGKVFSFSLKELRISNSHDDVAQVSQVAHDDNNNDDDIELEEALKDSIFEVHSPGSATHHRRNSSTFSEDGDPFHPYDFDHLDGTQAENSRKKRALLRRFGDLIKRSTTYTYAKKEPTLDLRKDPSLDSKKDAFQDALPE